MKSRKRKYIWASLLLTGALCFPGKMMVWANEEIGETKEEIENGETLSGGMLSDNETNELEIFQNETENGEDSVSDGMSDNEVISENTESETENEASKSVSENEEEGYPQLSDNSLSADSVELKDNAVSDNQEEILKKESIDVILPTEVPFNVIYWGEEKREAWIRSNQYCIENRGYDDVLISIEGVCLGENAEDYAVVGTTTEEVFVQNKKNVWAYLKWEDEEREEAEGPEILMGDASNPGRGEIILKAPERNKKGKITGENRDSKAYFSFVGDMKSDMDQGWESEELKMELNFFINELEESERNMKISKEKYVPEDSDVNMEAELF